MRTHNRSRLAAIFVTCSLAASAEAAPPEATQNETRVARKELLARAPAPVSAPVVHAQPAASTQAAASEKPITPAERANMMRAAEAKLLGQDVEGVEQALAQLALLGGADAAKMLSARVSRGLPPQLIEPAVSALLATGQPSVAKVLLELTAHRRWQVREAAFAALGQLGAKTAQPALLAALDDPSAEVRASAANALATVGDARALPALTLAMERGVEGAALALGQRGSSKEADLLLGRAKKGDLAAVETGLHAMLMRANLPVPLKIKIVNSLVQIQSPAIGEVLTIWAQSFTGDARVLQALKTSASGGSNVAVATQTSPSSTPAVQGDKP